MRSSRAPDARAVTLHALPAHSFDRARAAPRPATSTSRSSSSSTKTWLLSRGSFPPGSSGTSPTRCATHSSSPPAPAPALIRPWLPACPRGPLPGPKEAERQELERRAQLSPEEKGPWPALAVTVPPTPLWCISHSHPSPATQSAYPPSSGTCSAANRRWSRQARRCRPGWCARTTRTEDRAWGSARWRGEGGYAHCPGALVLPAALSHQRRRRQWRNAASAEWGQPKRVYLSPTPRYVAPYSPWIPHHALDARHSWPANASSCASSVGGTCLQSTKYCPVVDATAGERQR